MSNDTFTGVAAALATHDSAWALGSTAEGESIADLRIDGSGFCIQNNNFGTTTAFYTGTSAALKSEIVVPIGAFATLPSSETVGVFVCGGTGGRGIQAELNSANLTGQVINSINIRSGTNFVATQPLTPTIDTASVALTMSIRRTSTTNCDLIVNGTTYNINTTGLDITSGSSGIFLHRNSATATTLKIDSWTDGAAGGTTITPTAGALTLSGQAPTVAVSGATTRTPTAGALAFTGQAPTVAQSGSTTIAPTAGALAFAGIQPVLTLTVAAIGVGALSFTGQAPTIGLGFSRIPAAGALSLSGQQPTVVAVTTTTRIPGVGSLTFTGLAPSVANSGGPSSIAPLTATVTLSGFAPIVQNSGLVGSGAGPALILDIRRRQLLS